MAARDGEFPSVTNSKINGSLRFAPSARTASPRPRFAVSQTGNAISSLESAAQPKISRPQLEGAVLLAFLQAIAIAGERVQRKGIAVQVIFQVEHARKAGPRKLTFA